MRIIVLALCFFAGNLLGQDSAAYIEEDLDYTDSEAYTDSLIESFRYQQGEVQIGDGMATLRLPEGYKFLDGEQSYYLVTDVWENPPSVAIGMLGVIMHADADVYDASTVFFVHFEDIGYVPDEDADGIDYAAKMKDMLRDDSLENAQRIADGYSSLRLIGWASAPYYDKERKVLHWAKEMESDDREAHVLNHNIRVLGRKGVLVINAVSNMDRLDIVQSEVPEVLAMVSFNDGFRYDQFDPETDQVSAQGLDGLIDGKTRERVREFGMLLIKVAVGGFIGLLLIVLGIWFLFIRKRN